MDPLTHLALTRLLVGSERTTLAAGLLPDAPFYLFYPAWVICQGALRSALAMGEWPQAPIWMERPHHLTHSLPIVLAITLLYRRYTSHWPRWAWAWGLHILIDLPTHARGQWAPQFLWPFSDRTCDGVAWVELLFALLRRRSSRE